MTDGITRFLPQYPNIVPYEEDNLLNPYNGTFYNTIYQKKELYDLRLSKIEEVPKNPGELMNHQKIIARYLSSHTPYNGVLLFHEMGTGKTCSAVGAIEEIKSEGKFRGAIYISSLTLSKNFLNELINVCTDGRYIPEDIGETTRTEKIRMKKAVSDYYKLGKNYTYDKFAKRISNMRIKEIRQTFNNHVIVIDEVHNLADNNKEGASYHQIWKFLHQIQGCKVLLLSGTPMRNKVWDIASVMNLILPETSQLPTGEKFIKSYCTRIGKDLDIITNKGADILKEVFKGRVSYLRGITSDVKREFHGKRIKIPEIQDRKEYFKVSESMMSRFQTNAYEKAWAIDTKEGDEESEKKKGSGYYRNSRQASLFVFPDGTWGTRGFQQYIQRKKSRINFGRKTKSRYIWSKAGKSLDKEIKSGGIDALTKYSCKYAASCRIIEKAINDDRLVFVYNESVSEGGIILFTLILRALGYIQSTGKVQRKDIKTFAVLTGDTSHKHDIIRNFNSPSNIDGSRINLIIGSQAVSEGISLKNVQVEIIQTAWFNYARIDQALARGYRAGSHVALKSKLGSSVTQDIYLQVAIPAPITSDDKLQGIDVQMYNLAQKKDISFKKIEVIMRSAAFDCALTYNRNMVLGVPDTRECNYSNCDYKCIGIPDSSYKGESGGLSSKDLDYSTYQLYYDSEKINSIVTKIVDLFSVDFILSIDDIQEDIPTDTEFELLSALDIIISNSIPILNRYGFTSYLQEEKDMYFLVDSLSTIGSVSMGYYTKYPNVKIDQSFATIRQKYFIEIALPRAIRELCATKEEIRPYIARLPIECRVMFLENSVKARLYREQGRKFTNEQVALIDKILLYFDPDIHKSDEIIISSILQTYGGPLRCLNTTKEPLTWRDCTENEEEKYTKGKSHTRARLEKESFYGQINRKVRRFCIRDCRTGCTGEDVLGHKLTSGLECSSYKHHELGLIATFYTEMPVPPTNTTKEYILSGACGPPLDKLGKFEHTQIREINNGVAQIVGSNFKIKSLKIANTEKGLRKFFLTTANKVRDINKNSKIIPVRAKQWFSPSGELFRHLVILGDGAPKDTIDLKWKSVAKGIRKMTFPQMQRLIYYGTLKKATICPFLCAWFHNNDLLVNDNYCGSGNKPKPKKAA